MLHRFPSSLMSTEALRQGDFFLFPLHQSYLIYLCINQKWTKKSERLLKDFLVHFLLNEYKLNKKNSKHSFCFCITLVPFQSDSAHFHFHNPKSSVYFPLWLLRAQKCHLECNATNRWPAFRVRHFQQPASPSLTYMTAISSKWLHLRVCCRNPSLPLSHPGERRRLQRDIERDRDFSSQACLLSHCGLFRTEAHH